MLPTCISFLGSTDSDPALACNNFIESNYNIFLLYIPFYNLLQMLFISPCTNSYIYIIIYYID